MLLLRCYKERQLHLVGIVTYSLLYIKGEHVTFRMLLRSLVGAKSFAVRGLPACLW